MPVPVPVLTRDAVARAAAPTAALAATAWWLIEVTRSWAGRDAPSVTVGALLVAVAVVLSRPHRVLPASWIAVVAALSIGAFVVPLTAPSGWAGAPTAAVYTCTAWLAVVVAALVVERPDLRVWFVTLVVASAAIEFISGWLGWWGGRDPAQPMIGTFYWHNPYAIFLIPGGVLGLALFIWRERVYALLGVVAFVLACVGVVYSTSRASFACLVAGVAAVGVAAVVDPRRLRALRQLALAAVLGAGAVYLVGGPPFFPHRASPLAGEQARSAGQSLGQNGGYRIDFWREALTVFGRHPVTGSGYKSMAYASIGHVPAKWPLSPYAHNGYLQALSDGGLVLGIPFLLAVGTVAVLCVRALWVALRSRRLGVNGFVVPVALALLLLHSAIDFDWIYAADLAMTAVVAGLVLGRRLATAAPAAAAAEAEAEAEAEQPTTPRRPLRVVLTACVLAGVALLGLSAWVMRHGDHRENLPVSHSA